jgi:hypothetical protein
MFGADPRAIRDLVVDLFDIMFRIQCRECLEWRWAWQRCPCRIDRDPK